jgi:Tfp pilus assembly protein PilV
MTGEAYTLFIELMHANTKQPIVVYVPNIFTFYYSDAHKSTLLIANAGGIIPVEETTEQVKAAILKRTSVQIPKVRKNLNRK